MEEIKIYVVFQNGKLLDGTSNKVAYLKESYAKTIITSKAKEVAYNLYQDNGGKKPWYDWYESDKDEYNYWLELARRQFEIRIFVEKKE